MSRTFPTATSRRMSWKAALLVALLALFLGGRFIATYIIEYQWWKELNQVTTWIDMLSYGVAPVVAASFLAFVILWVAHARAMKFAGTSLRNHPGYALLSTLVLFVTGIFLA